MTEGKYTLTTSTGFTAEIPENMLDDWKFLEALSRASSEKETESLSGFFDFARMLLGEDGLEELENHVKYVAGYGYPSFSAMSKEIGELIALLKQREKN